jgi:tRNA (guanine-N7-)-methyltransferase
MGRRKLDKFKDNEKSRNVIQSGKEIFEFIKGNWNQMYFRNENPVVLELACGKGEYTVGLARLFPEKNIIGVDIKGSRIWKGSRIAETEGLLNVAFLRIQIQHLDQYFEENEADEIWITFPDPRPRERDEHRRLTHPRFLYMYQNILRPDGWVHLKTDNEGLFEYSLEVLSSFNFIRHLEFTRDLYQSGLLIHHHGIQTTYEKRFLEDRIPIKYLRFRIKTGHED